MPWRVIPTLIGVKFDEEPIYIWIVRNYERYEFTEICPHVAKPQKACVGRLEANSREQHLRKMDVPRIGPAVELMKAKVLYDLG